MSELWLPVDRLTRSPIVDIAAGRLLILPPSGQDNPIPCVGIRFNAGQHRLVFGLTSFQGGRPGDATDVSTDRGSALTLDAALTIQGDFTAPGARGSLRDFRPGELVATDEGIALAAAFNRQGNGYQSCRLVKVPDWEVIYTDSGRIIFGAWRLQIDIVGLRSIYWTPAF